MKLLRKNKKAGHIYIATNEYIPDLLKIGMTRNLKTRISSLSNSTSVPGKYKLQFKLQTENLEEVEILTHAMLHDYRIDLSKEFFYASLELAIKAIQKSSNRISEDPSYNKNLFINAGKKWDVRLAKLAIDIYNQTGSITQISQEIQKYPIEVDSFLNQIGFINTRSVKSNQSFKGFPNNCYKDGTFEEIIKGDIPLNKPKRKIGEPLRMNLNELDKQLESDLKRYRIRVSRTRKIQAFKIFSNKALNEFIKNKPVTKSEFLNVDGFYEYQYQSHGEELSKIINRYRYQKK